MDRSPMGGQDSVYFPQGLPSDNNEMEGQDYSDNQSPDNSPSRSQIHSQIMSQNRNTSYSQINNQGKPPISANIPQHTSMLKDATATKMGPDSSKINQTTMRQHTNNRTRTDFDRDPDGTVYGESMQKKITTTSHQRSKIHSDVSPTLKETSFKPTNFGMPTMTGPQMMQVPMVMPAPEKVEEEVPPDYVRIGDIVCIQFLEQVFDGLKEYAKIDGGKDNLRLAKILEKPDFEYTGFIYSDGIVNKDIKLGTEETLRDKNKAIFRIEVVQDYKFIVNQNTAPSDFKQFHDLKIEIASAEPGEFENPTEEEEKLSIYKEIKKRYLKEIKSNQSEQKYKTGSKVLYGQLVQFKHITSGLYLTLDTKKLSSQYGCFELLLSHCNESSRFQLLPSESKTKYLNEPITYNDNFIVQNTKDSSEYFLH